MKQDLVINPPDVRVMYQKNLNKKLSKDDENVMLGHNVVTKTTFEVLRTRQTYNHIVNIGYDGRTVSTTTQDPAELERIFSHL